jgi:hypothetical protein
MLDAVRRFAADAESQCRGAAIANVMLEPYIVCNRIRFCRPRALNGIRLITLDLDQMICN